jgi:hypothetical protein
MITDLLLLSIFGLHPAVQAPVSAPKDCADFSGVWNGSATKGTTVTPVWIVFIQCGCERFGNTDLMETIGGTTTMTETAPAQDGALPVTTTVMHTITWNSAKDKLIQTENATVAPVVGGSPLDTSQISTVSATEVMRLDGDQLVNEAKISGDPVPLKVRLSKVADQSPSVTSMFCATNSSQELHKAK